MSQGFDVNLFYLTFISYLVGLVAFSLFAAFQRNILHRTGAGFMLIGAAGHTVAFFVRWKLAGHIPLSNMYEYMSLMSLMAVIMLLFFYVRYNLPIIGSFISPVVFMLMVAAALLPKNVNQSLMPALQSVWLYIHVSLAALGAGCFVISFASSSMYLIKQYNPLNNKDQNQKKQIRAVFICLLVMPLVLTIMAYITGLIPPAPLSKINIAGFQTNSGSLFILLGLGFMAGLIMITIIKPKVINGNTSSFGGWLFITVTISILLGGLVEGLFLKAGWLKLTHSLPHTGSGNGVKSAWLFFEFIGFAYLAALLFSIILSPLILEVSKGFSNSRLLDLKKLDEVSYRSVSMGYPLYTVGALFAGAIWAEQAWGSFWSWDPKEVGALIVWLFYSGYLHARFQRDWRGSRSAILVVSGFLMVLISFFGNYFFGGLHAYT